MCAKWLWFDYIESLHVFHVVICNLFDPSGVKHLNDQHADADGIHVSPRTS